MTRADDIIDALRAARVEHGLSQRAVSDLLRVAPSSVGQWERRFVRPATAAKVAAWHRVLGLDPPPDLEAVFAPAVPACRSRPALRRHSVRREYCEPCWTWWAAYLRDWRAKKRAA